jgi:hypothetical protein
MSRFAQEKAEAQKPNSIPAEIDRPPSRKSSASGVCIERMTGVSSIPRSKEVRGK